MLLVVISGSLSCGDRVTGLRGAPAPDVRLELTASPSSGSSSEPVTIRRVVRNLGRETIDVAYDCSGYIRIEDATGSNLLLRDPRIPLFCLGIESLPLSPGEVWETELVFDGTYYDALGAHLEVGPGTYRARTSVTYYGARAPVTLEHAIPFTWR